MLQQFYIKFTNDKMSKCPPQLILELAAFAEFQGSAGDVRKTAYDDKPLWFPQRQSLFIIVYWSHPKCDFQTLIKTHYNKKTHVVV